jgi:ankyrin repeat protein
MIDRIADGRTDLVFEHLAEGHPASSTDAGGVALIRWCAYYGDVSAIRHLVANGESLDSLGPNFDLNGAAFHGHWQLVQFLIERGADVDLPLPDTLETPLHAALCHSDRPRYNHVLRVLLSHGAAPNRSTAHGVETGSFMRDCRTKGETPLHLAAAHADEEAIRLLLAAGARKDAEDMHGDTPLGWASRHSRPGYVLELLCYGEHRIHPDAVRRSRNDPRMGWTSAMSIHLLGSPHTPQRQSESTP